MIKLQVLEAYLDNEWVNMIDISMSFRLIILLPGDTCGCGCELAELVDGHDK